MTSHHDTISQLFEEISNIEAEIKVHEKNKRIFETRTEGRRTRLEENAREKAALRYALGIPGSPEKVPLVATKSLKRKVSGGTGGANNSKPTAPEPRKKARTTGGVSTAPQAAAAGGLKRNPSRKGRGLKAD
ncbi:hypothetical protein C8R43DRAFT_1240335 [Mycena crocata]|nr:hypothetical protein C8R43DRAFT_1240335 [Mycena crocata]